MVKERFTSGAGVPAVATPKSPQVSLTKSPQVSLTKSPQVSLIEAEGAPNAAPADAWTVHDGEQLLRDLRSGLQREVSASLIASLIASLGIRRP